MIRNSIRTIYKDVLAILACIPLSSTPKLLNTIQFTVKLGIEDYKLASSLEFFL